MRLRHTLLLGLSAGLLLTACQKQLVGVDPVNAPETNFDLLWTEFDQWYALFGVRRVDWDSTYAVYRPLVKPTTTEEELWQITTRMLGTLRDSHVTLFNADTTREFNAGNFSGQLPDNIDLNLIRQTYLKKGAKTAGEGEFTYGWLSDEIGYIYVKSFARTSDPLSGAGGWANDIDAILTEFQPARGVVIDVRNYEGGTDYNAQRIANAFADRKRLFMTVRTRNGPRHSDFDQPSAWYLEPNPAITFTRPIVVLTHRQTISAGDVFTLAMKTLPHATQIGDTTNGVFSNVSFERQLPNGWTYSLSHQLYLDPVGRSYEGVGIPPAIVVKNTKAEIGAGTDRALERAIAHLKAK